MPPLKYQFIETLLPHIVNRAILMRPVLDFFAYHIQKFFPRRSPFLLIFMLV